MRSIKPSTQGENVMSTRWEGTLKGFAHEDGKDGKGVKEKV